MVKPLLAQRADHARQRLHDHRRQAFGDLVEQQQLARRCAGCAPPPASAARRPTGACPGWRGARAGWGTSRRSRPRSCRPRPAAAAAAGSPRRSGWRRCRAPRGSSRCPSCAMRCGGMLTASVPLTLIEPLRAADQAQDGAQRGGAPGAVAAEQRHHLAAVHREVDAVQDVRLAVPGVQVFQAQQFSCRCSVSHARPAVRRRRCPCRPRSPAGSSTPRRTALRRAPRRAAAR